MTIDNEDSSLTMPDAVEDTSDDEPDVLSTPSATHSSSMLSLVDPASVPLPAQWRRRRLHLHVQVDLFLLVPFRTRSPSIP
jgi:hypothetical protein